MTKIRIDKLLSNMNRGTRSEIKKYAKQGRIKVNGQIEKNSASIVDTEKDRVSLDDVIVHFQEHIYLVMNKPQNVVSATHDNLHQTVIDILSEEYRGFHPFPVGRLDIDTEGLLIITNDGHFAHNLLSPKKHVCKKYFVEVTEKISDRDIQQFREGIILDDGYRTMHAVLEALAYSEETDSSTCFVTIQEGKYHQIKRMFAGVQKKVLFLKRVQMGSLLLDEALAPGEYRALTEEELHLLNG